MIEIMVKDYRKVEGKAIGEGVSWAYSRAPSAVARLNGRKVGKPKLTQYMPSLARTVPVQEKGIAPRELNKVRYPATKWAAGQAGHGRSFAFLLFIFFTPPLRVEFFRLEV